MNNPVRFVSLGPGNPDLITVQSLKALQQAELVFCPATSAGESRAADLLRELGVGATIRPFLLPMRKDRTDTLAVYRSVMSDVAAAYAEGVRVAVTVEGDAGIYASIHYILDGLVAMGIPVEQLCGIPSFIAAGAVAGLHLISLEQRLVVLPGNVTAEELDAYLAGNHVPLIMKLSRNADVLHTYMAAHPECAYHYFENVSTENEYYSCDREELAGKAFPYFSLLIIHPAG